MGQCKKFLAETVEKFYVLVSRDFAMIFSIGYRTEIFVLMFFCLKNKKVRDLHRQRTPNKKQFNP